MLVAYKNSMLKSMAELGVAHSDSLSLLFLPFPNVLPFTIIYRKKISSHLRFMISTAVIMVNS